MSWRDWNEKRRKSQVGGGWMRRRSAVRCPEVDLDKSAPIAQCQKTG